MTEGQPGEHRRDDLKVQGFGDPLYIETGPDTQEKEPISSVIRGLFRSLLDRKNRESEVFDLSGHVEWDKVCKLINPSSKTRAAIFPRGTGEMSEHSIIEFITSNYPTFVEDGIDPLEFPEFADRELRPIFNTIGNTTWGHPYDGSSGHPVREKEILYNQSFLRVLLDLNDPSANKYIAEAEKLRTEWMQKYPNLEISMHTDKIVGSRKKPRVISYGIKMNVKAPEGANDDYIKSDECHQISSGFFEALNQRIATMQN